MAHFAKISENNKVLTVHVLDNLNMQNVNGVEDETIGQQYLEQHSNWPAEMWIQTSYNTFNSIHKLGGTPLRGNYAAIGYIWDETNQIFWPPKPRYLSWVKNILTATWESPIGPAPTITAEQQSQNTAATHFWKYSWNENDQTWNLTNYLA